MNKCKRIYKNNQKENKKKAWMPKEAKNKFKCNSNKEELKPICQWLKNIYPNYPII